MLLWLEHNPRKPKQKRQQRKPLDQIVREACAAYRRQDWATELPNLILANPTDIQEQTEVRGVTIRPDPYVLKYHYYVLHEEQK